MTHSYTIAACAALSLLATTALAHDRPMPSDHAPLGVMGDHLHKEGEWMVGYRYSQQRTDGIRNGSDGVSNHMLLMTYGETPTEMTMRMHMFEVMYGISDSLTLMVMPQYMEMEMTHMSHMPGHSHGHAHTVGGLGDTSVTGLYSLWNDDASALAQNLHLNIGLSVPTGSIDERFTNHHNNNYPLPSNMQLGSGTFDPIIGLTYNGHLNGWSWGAQTLNTFRFIGENENDYRLGNRYTVNLWGARDLNEVVSVSVRLEGEKWDDVDGRDISLPLTTIVGANPNLLAGERMIAHAGLNLRLPDSWGAAAGHRLAFEAGVPVYQHFDGPQPDEDYRFTVGWQYAF